MKTRDYNSDLWALIYDQYHQRNSSELPFYRSELATCTGPVLELACGTGLLLIPLLEQEWDMHGLDLSLPMLDVLYQKADQKGMADIQQRVTCQNMVDFQSETSFEVIFIAARSFLHLVTQEEQIACLRNIHHHLQPQGRLLLNFFTPRHDMLVRYASGDSGFMDRGSFTHLETGEPIQLSMRQTNDLANQVQHLTWRFQIGSECRDVPMTVRWIYRSEFELLAKLTGFEVAALYSGFERELYKGEGEMVWVLEKISNSSEG